MTVIISPDYSDLYKEHGGLWRDNRIYNPASQDPFSTTSDFWGPAMLFKDRFLIENDLEQNMVVMGVKFPVTGKIYTIELLCLQKIDLADYELNLVLLSGNKSDATIKTVLIDSIKGTDENNPYYSKFPLTIDANINDFIGLINISEHTVLPISEYTMTVNFVEG